MVVNHIELLAVERLRGWHRFRPRPSGLLRDERRKASSRLRKLCTVTLGCIDKLLDRLLFGQRPVTIHAVNITSTSCPRRGAERSSAGKQIWRRRRSCTVDKNREKAEPEWSRHTAPPRRAPERSWRATFPRKGGASRGQGRSTHAPAQGSVSQHAFDGVHRTARSAGSTANTPFPQQFGSGLLRGRQHRCATGCGFDPGQPEAFAERRQHQAAERCSITIKSLSSRRP